MWATRRSRRGRGQIVTIMGLGVIGWLGGLALMAYMAAATALYMVLDSREHNLVTWEDCVLVPIRWDEIKRKRGDGYIEAGLVALQDQRWSEAILRLQAGLSRSPDNRHGREQLAAFYLAAGQRERGLNLILEGIERSYPGLETMKRFYTVAATGEDFETALAGLDVALASDGPAASRDRVWLVEQKARVLLAMQRWDELTAWVEQNEVRTAMLQETHVVALIEKRDFEKATTALDAWLDAGGVEDAVRRLRVRLAREQRDMPTMRAELKVMRELAATSPKPWVYAVIQEYLADDPAMAKERLSDYLLRFGAKLPNLLLVLNPLLEIEAWELFDAVLADAEQQGLRSFELEVAKMEASIKRGDYEAAAALLAGMTQDFPKVAARRERWLQHHSLSVDAMMLNEDSAQGALVEWTRRTPLRLDTIKKLAGQLEEAGRSSTAHQILTIAGSRYPGSRQLREEQERLQAEIRESEPVPIELPQIRDGEELVLSEEFAIERDDEEEQRVMQNPVAFMRVWDAAFAREDLNEAQRLLREVRRERPAWLGAQESALQDREMRLYATQEDWASLVTLVRFRLDGSMNRSLDAMKLVRQLDEQGKRRGAELVLAEVERRDPKFPPALRQRQEWLDQTAEPGIGE